MYLMIVEVLFYTIIILLKKEVAHTFYAQPLLGVLLILLEELFHQFYMLIGHFNYGVAVGAVEVDEPLFCDDSSGLGFYKFYITLLHPTVDRVFGIACNFYNLWHGESVGIFIELTPNPLTEFIRQRRWESSFP